MPSSVTYEIGAMGASMCTLWLVVYVFPRAAGNLDNQSIIFIAYIYPDNTVVPKLEINNVITICEAEYENVSPTAGKPAFNIIIPFSKVKCVFLLILICLLQKNKSMKEAKNWLNTVEHATHIIPIFSPGYIMKIKYKSIPIFTIFANIDIYMELLALS